LEPRTVLTVFTPIQITHAYGIDKLGLDGTNQTIAIVDAFDDPSIAGDLATFNSNFGLAPATLNKVDQTGGVNYPALDTGWALEIALDVEWAHAVAPKATILLVEANSNSYSDLLAAVDYASAHASVVSMSWGGGEFSAETSSSYDGHFSNHPGVTFVAASGDSGKPPARRAGATEASAGSSGAAAVASAPTRPSRATRRASSPRARPSAPAPTWPTTPTPTPGSTSTTPTTAACWPSAAPAPGRRSGPA
jgi:hypothetical protein